MTKHDDTLMRLLGADYFTKGISPKLEALMEALAHMTIPGKIAVLERGFLQAAEDDSRPSLTAELADVKAKLAAAEAATAEAVQKAIDATLDSMHSQVEARADARATELMAAVGQTRPVTTAPVTAASPDAKATLTGIAAIEARYRESGKYSGKDE